MCIVDPDPALCDTTAPRPSRRKKFCTDQSLLKITTTVPDEHSSPGPARVFRAVFSPVVQAGFFPVVRFKGLNSLSKFSTPESFFSKTDDE
ncbi:hypothetical protein PoB_006118900 [Plakobranchus ocellatus]|uniref:Uncharacterized protein n=1 Tax=Plakobranchus ocellatus TaxID=259542 RepID=A0AAV4CS18_9GAST|nr:hypothetical protein PoB_006118900 [Plakobranchus ocellatus]